MAAFLRAAPGTRMLTSFEGAARRFAVRSPKTESPFAAARNLGEFVHLTAGRTRAPSRRRPRFSTTTATPARKAGTRPGPPMPTSAEVDDEKSAESTRDVELSADALRRLFEMAAPERNLILASAATLAVTSSITLLLPYACGHVLDAAVLDATTATAGDAAGGADRFSPMAVASGLFALTAAAGLGVYARSLMLNVAGNRIVRRVRTRLFASILSQEAAFFDGSKAGDLISRLNNDAWLIKGAVTTEAVAGLRGVVMSVGSTSLLFYTSPSLAVVSLLSIPPVFLMARVVGRSLKEKQKVVQSLHGEATNVAEEAIGGIKTVQLFNAERSECGRYAGAISNAHEEEINVGRTKAAFDGVVHVAANGAVLLVLGYGGTLVLANELSAGDLTGFLMYSLLMAGNVSSLSGTYAEAMKSVAAAGRVFDVIDRVPGIPSSLRTSGEEREEKAINPFVHGEEKESISIRFADVGFAYPARPEVPVLGPNFCLEIDPGQNIALVGGSGAGKSTVSLLLARMYNLDKGDIFLNGHNITDIEPSILREQIGVVSQEPLLFDGTIAENIRYGRPDASDEDILEAARAAHVTHFTAGLPLGLDTQVGPRGTQLSGGQKQRVAIARVMLKDPPICVLDEATSALDARSEYHINQALKAMTKGRTVISIAHRLSTIREADLIAVVENGEIAETGTFEQLIKSEGRFHRLMKQQLTDL